MAMKPFEIQSADLKLGGVTLQAGNTGVVIPGVTQATNYRVEEVDDIDDDQSATFLSAPMVIDYVTAQDLNNTGTTSNRATYSAEIEDDGKIDEIEADSEGSYTSIESQTNGSNNMLAYTGSDSDPLVNWNFQDWVIIPFRPKMRAGEVERIGGDSEADLGSFTIDSNVIDVEPGTDIYIETSEDGGSGESRLVLKPDDDQGGSNPTRLEGSYGVGIWTNTTDSDNVKEWLFGNNGDLKLPAGGDIVDSTGASVLGGSGGSGNGLDPYVTIDDGKVSVTADIDFPASDVSGVISTISGEFNFDVYFQETTGDASGNMYATGRSQEGNSYAIVYAFNPNGSVKWKTSLTISGNTQTPELHNIKLKGDYVYVGFTYYDNDAGTDYHGVAKLVAETGALNYDWIIETPQNTYPQIYDIAINANDEPIMVGTYGNGLDTLSNVPTQAGSGINSVIFNTSDLQGYTSQSGWGGQWRVETAPGVFTYPDYTNSAYVPVTNLTNPSATGMIAAFRYDQNQSNYWGGVIINDPGTYNVGDQLKVPGSLLFGIDGVNDATWTFNGGQLNNLAGTPSEELKAKTWFSWNSPGPNGSETDFTSSTNVNLKTYLGNQAMIWTPSWNYTYGTTDSEYFYGVAYDSANDKIYAAGEFWHNDNGIYHDGALFKINGSDGVVEWSKYVEDNTGASDNLRSVLVDSSGNVITIGKNNSGYSLVTKLNNSGDVVWQARQTNNNNWDNDPRGAIDSDDNVYVTGVWNGNNNYVSIMKLNGNDGSLNWARTFNNSEGYNFNDFYDESSQTTNIAGTNLYYGGYCYDANDDSRVAVALRLPLDGTGTGTYGRWIYAEDITAQWEDCTSSSNLYTATFPAVTFDGQTLTGEKTNSNIDSIGNAVASANAVGGSGSNITNVGGITFADGTTQTTAAVSNPPITWTNGNGNTWRIETYNGGYNGTYDGDDYDARWFDVNDAPSGDNNFRGAIIEYHAYFNGQGTMVGTIHMSRDNDAGDFVTHTEHMSGDSNMQKMSVWFTNGNDRRLYFKRTDGNTQEIMIQWTAKIFYGSEYYC